MQDKLIAMDESLLEDLEETGSVEDQQSPTPTTLPMIEVTHFDESDHPEDSYRRPLHSFL